MATVHGKKLLVVGDWVSGTSFLDERLIGYVESIDSHGVVDVWVTQSDHDDAVGQLVQSKLAKLEKLPDYEPSEPEDLRSLIELALATRDQAWFEELSTKLAGAEGEGGALSSDGKPARPQSFTRFRGKRVSID
ncbi:IDEAL domain-containing protein [Paenibacillus cremeus]|uniref:IDEAL domain-containing protein n=1 Tax=Paenibacillus cremeus TaxID=2163881 RepID=A0A559K4C0_9BACL|nr:IDEAL domain-containing protein [Paenibacillus cremeus]TVY06974.1 IDEAL domain-containing protein [Paenibacillus cremeus]